MAKRKHHDSPPPPPPASDSGIEIDLAGSTDENEALGDSNMPSIPPPQESPLPTVPVQAAWGTAVSKSVAKGRFGKGWKADPHDPRDFSTRALLGARRGANPDEATLEQFVVGIRDQGQTSSCVGQATARAIHVRMAAAGTPIEYPSALGIYDVGRAMERNARGQLLQDEGTQPRLAMTGIRSWGVPPESAWPFVEANVNTEPPMDVLARASAFKLANWYRIDAQGNGRIDDVCQALAAKHPIILGVEVDDAFENYQRGQVLTAPTSQTYGGHMLCLVGYRTVNGVKQFRGVNSWGTGWGDRGLFWADSAWLTDPRAGDLYVLVVTGV